MLYPSAFGMNLLEPNVLLVVGNTSSQPSSYC